MIIGAMLVKNEAGRWLRTVLEQMKAVCDRIVVVDDRSTDNTRDICREYGADVYVSEKSYWGTDELKQRKRLWKLATEKAGDGGWILCLDADETFAQGHIEKLPAIVANAESIGLDAIGFNLFDMWDEEHYRDDSWWTAHKRQWIMCMRYHEGVDYKWRETALHCGRFPLVDTWPVKSGLHLQHWGWSRAEDRRVKYERYMRADPKGEFGVMAQYKSILDETPNLVPFKRKLRVLIGAPVRQDPDIFQEYIKSLDNLDTEGLEVDRLFIIHNSPDLIQYIRDKDIYVDFQPDQSEEYVKNEYTHYWTDGNLGHVIFMKNNLLGYTLEHGYDYFLLVDSDLILHPNTLQQLLSAQKSIVANVFWTKFKPELREAPNAWDYDQYNFLQGNPESWRVPGLYSVGMSGACILISKEAILAGVNYNPIYNLSFRGEDRTFCVRAAALGIEIFLDTHYPCKHLYRRSEYEDYKKEGGYDGFKANYGTDNRACDTGGG